MAVILIFALLIAYAAVGVRVGKRAAHELQLDVTGEPDDVEIILIGLFAMVAIALWPFVWALWTLGRKQLER